MDRKLYGNKTRRIKNSWEYEVGSKKVEKNGKKRIKISVVSG